MTTYGPQAATALAILRRKGKILTFTRKNPGTLDPVTQERTGASTTTFSMYGLGVPPGRSAQYVLGTLEGRNLMELHLATNEGTAPAPGDTVAFAGATWSLLWVSNLDPVGEGAVYTKAYIER